MLAPINNLAYLNGLRSRQLDSAALLREREPQEWVCYSGQHMIVVRWQLGCLGMGVGETEYEAYGDIKIVAVDQARVKTGEALNFIEVIDFMNWTIDDDSWFE